MLLVVDTTQKEPLFTLPWLCSNSVTILISLIFLISMLSLFHDIIVISDGIGIREILESLESLGIPGETHRQTNIV